MVREPLLLPGGKVATTVAQRHYVQAQINAEEAAKYLGTLVVQERAARQALYRALAERGTPATADVEALGAVLEKATEKKSAAAEKLGRLQQRQMEALRAWARDDAASFAGASRA